MRQSLSVIFQSLIFLSIYLLLNSALFAKEEKPDSGIQQDQIKTIEKDLIREKEKYLKFGEKEKSILGKLSEYEEKIAEQNKFLKELRVKIEASKKELRRQQAKQKQLANSLSEISYRLERRLVAFYKYAKRGYLQLLGSSKGFEQLRKRVKYLKVITEEDRHLFRQMAELQVTNNQKIIIIKEKLAAIDEMERTEKERLQLIRKEVDKKVILLMKIHREKEFYETAVKELEQASLNLKDTIVNIQKEKPKKTHLPKGFGKLKGRLPVPFKGRIIKNRSPLGADGKNNHKGIYIKGPVGSKVRAVYGGRVDYSGWLKGYGQIIVINHGSRYFSISAHLLERYKAEGDMVEQGEVIGLLGQTGSLTGPKLYFELREGSTNLDPGKWLKVR